MAQPDNGPELLSEYLQLCIEDAETDSAEDSDAKRVVEKLIKKATSSLEGFAKAESQELITFWKRNPNHWKWAVDDFYSRGCVAEVPKIVRRFLKLSPVLVGRIPSVEVSTYLREATTCFLHGFFQGRIALSRAALEAGVNDLFSRQLGRIPTVDLVDKLRHLERSGILKNQDSHEAHYVRKAAGAVLHQSPASEESAYDTLLKARHVLMKLYRS
jgi:hypothetical protein